MTVKLLPWGSKRAGQCLVNGDMPPRSSQSHNPGPRGNRQSVRALGLSWPPIAGLACIPGFFAVQLDRYENVAEKCSAIIVLNNGAFSERVIY